MIRVCSPSGIIREYSPRGWWKKIIGEVLDETSEEQLLDLWIQYDQPGRVFVMELEKEREAKTTKTVALLKVFLKGEQKAQLPVSPIAFHLT
jgi:hypothetical protein